MTKKGRTTWATPMDPVERKTDLQRYFDSLPDQVIVLDREMNVEFLNAGAAKYIGVAGAELVKNPLNLASLAENYGVGLRKFSDSLANALLNGGSEVFETEFIRNGSDTGFEISVRASRDEKGIVLGVVLNFHDISLRHKARRELAMQNSHLTEMVSINATMIEVLSALNTGQTLDEIFGTIFEELRKIIPYDRIGLALLDGSQEHVSVVKVRSDHPVMVEKGYACLLGYTSLGDLLDPEKRISNDLLELEGGRRRIIFDLGKYVNSRHRRTPYNELLLAEGIHSSLTVPLYVGKRPTAFIFFSSRHQRVYTREYLGEKYDTCMHLLDSIQGHLALALEKGVTIMRLEETNRRLKELLTMKDDFLSIASHDLRAPLTSIMGFTGIMVRQPQISEFQRKALETISNSAGHLLMLVDDILALAKANSGKMELAMEPVFLKDILGQSLSAMAFNAHNKNIEILHERAVCPQTMADRSKMFQVFNNLIGNAIKFSPEGSEIQVREALSGGTYRFSVTDVGPGISADDQKHLFGKFVQVGTDKVLKHEGSGLGLMICKIIVELHGGTIGVVSEPGRGSTFSFSLPVTPPHART